MVEVKGSHQLLNIQLNDLPANTKELTLTCDDREAIELCHCLHTNDITLKRYGLV